MSVEKPRLCFVGPMLHKHRGWVPTQAETLADLFEQCGYPVLRTSSALNRYLRLADIVRFLISHRRQIDILCLQVYGGPSFVVEDIASRLGKRLGQHVVMMMKGGAMPDFMARWPGWTRRVLSRADAIVPPSRFLERSIRPYGFAATVVPNVLNLPAYTYRHRSQVKPRLFWMRAFEPMYNPELALRVVAHLRGQVPDVFLTMAGQDSGLQAATEKRARQLGVDDIVCFPGFLYREAKECQAIRHDIFLNTNRVDNMPVSVIEAAAWGLPVVATRVGGIPDLLEDESTGLLVPDDDEEAMANSVLRLMKEPDLASRLSSNGRALAESCAWERVRPMWEAVFSDVMGRGGA